MPSRGSVNSHASCRKGHVASLPCLLRPLWCARSGKPDPGGPQRADKERKRTYKTKDEVNKTRGLTSTIVLVLLFISVVVPMLQYWGYTSKE